VSSVSVAGVDLTVSDEMKVLGVVLDRRLSFDSHVRTVSKHRDGRMLSHYWNIYTGYRFTRGSPTSWPY